MKKKSTWRSLWFAPTLALILMLLGSTVANAVPAIGLTLDNQLVRFDTDTPETIISTVPITGLQTGEFIHGIDYRPDIGQLFGLGSRRRIYTINATTGVATPVNNAPFVPALTGNSFGVDINPSVNRLRVTSNRDENFRFNPSSGAATVDTPLAYAAGDPNEGADPNVVGVAYTNNNFSGTSKTTLYGIDYGLDTLVRIGGINGNPSPNGGQLTTIGPLGVNASQLLGFDIAPGTGTAFAVFRGTGGVSRLYTINLNTGHATLVGPTTGVSLRGLAIVTVDVFIYAVTADNDLLFFSSVTPGTITSKTPITGLRPGETILGLDFRPAAGNQLFALGSTSRLYRIDQGTGAATEVGSGPFSVPLSGSSFGFDFNPTVDRIRVTSDADQNLRLNPDDGTVVSVDTPLAYAAGDPNEGANPNVVGSAYTNSFFGSTTTTLYGIDNNLDVLVRQGGADGQPSPNGGLLTTTGRLTVDAVGPVGFDIVTPVFETSFNFAYASITGNGGVSRLYTINLATGKASLVGIIGGSESVVGIAATQSIVITRPAQEE
ncbi:MAG: DUF4394 domain-containing protein [Pyrinomonadaceae bacterium]